MSEENQIEVPVETPQEKEVNRALEPLIGVKAVKISDEDKEKFFKSFLADKPFIEEAALLHGKFKVIFRTLTIDENNDIMKQIGYDKIAGIAESNDSYFVEILNFRLAAAIVSINGIDINEGIDKKTHPYNKEDKGESFYVRARAKQFSSWNTYKLIAVQDAFRKFERKVATLTEEVQNENFWTAVV